MIETPTWWAEASCLGSGVGQWVVGPGDTRQMRRLQTICAACPVRPECLADAMSEPIEVRLIGPMRAGISGRAWRQVYIEAAR